MSAFNITTRSLPRSHSLKMPFQLNASTLFLTYPQCPLSKEVLRDELITYLENEGCPVVEYIVAEELHSNGDPHLHAYFKLGSAFRSRNAACFDVRGFHGNYQGCRSSKNVIKYCTKAEQYLSNIDVAAILAKTSTRRAIAEKIVKANLPLEEVIQDHPELIFGYQRLKMDIAVWQDDIGSKKLSLPTWLPNPWAKVLPSFRKSKRRHYWIWSNGPNYGKTTGFAKPLAEEYNAVIQAGNFSYWNVTRSLELLILDDYNTAQLNWSTLNQLCDNTYSFKVIYRGMICPPKYLVVILSNSPISSLYPHMNQYLYERFNEIQL